MLTNDPLDMCKDWFKPDVTTVPTASLMTMEVLCNCFTQMSPSGAGQLHNTFVFSKLLPRIV